jgi:hypothetical protein
MECPPLEDAGGAERLMSPPSLSLVYNFAGRLAE